MICEMEQWTIKNFGEKYFGELLLIRKVFFRTVVKMYCVENHPHIITL